MNENRKKRLNFGLFYDFRNPTAWKRPFTQIYGEIFEQIRWADQHGFDNVWLSEHHLVEDGYAPSLLPDRCRDCGADQNHPHRHRDHDPAACTTRSGWRKTPPRWM